MRNVFDFKTQAKHFISFQNEPKPQLTAVARKNNFNNIEILQNTKQEAFSVGPRCNAAITLIFSVNSMASGD